MTTTTVTTDSTTTTPCGVYSCESAHDPNPRHDCAREGYHRDRVWTHDTSGMQVRIGAVADLDGTPETVNCIGTHAVDNWEVLFVAENLEMEGTCETSLSLAELDGLIAMLTAARRDISRTVKS